MNLLLRVRRCFQPRDAEIAPLQAMRLARRRYFCRQQDVASYRAEHKTSRLHANYVYAAPWPARDRARECRNQETSPSPNPTQRSCQHDYRLSTVNSGVTGIGDSGWHHCLPPTLNACHLSWHHCLRPECPSLGGEYKIGFRQRAVKNTDNYERLGDYMLPTQANRVAPGFSDVGIVPYDAAARRSFFSGISRFPHPLIPVLLHTHLVPPSSALETSCCGALWCYLAMRITLLIVASSHKIMNWLALTLRIRSAKFEELLLSFKGIGSIKAWELIYHEVLAVTNLFHKTSGEKHDAHHRIVLSNDTDILILLLHFYDVMSSSGLKELWTRAGVGNTTRLIPVHKIADNVREICPFFLPCICSQEFFYKGTHNEIFYATHVHVNCLNEIQLQPTMFSYVKQDELLPFKEFKMIPPELVKYCSCKTCDKRNCGFATGDRDAAVFLTKECLQSVPAMPIRAHAAPDLGYRVSLRHLENALDYFLSFPQRDSGCGGTFQMVRASEIKVPELMSLGDFATCKKSNELRRNRQVNIANHRFFSFKESEIHCCAASNILYRTTPTEDLQPIAGEIPLNLLALESGEINAGNTKKKFYKGDEDWNKRRRTVIWQGEWDI
ncbi:hypothetical protein PR048_017408 [Dryococelus australis]|uniref:Uncharacterized protein n=1 Tax=Dryococelus australis TaxID=614101 RepID=A0ABQ9H9F4_9NEOP|nr:hypothetical protein PR048_017408 [Dryococelus australis]